MKYKELNQEQKNELIEKQYDAYDMMVFALRYSTHCEISMMRSVKPMEVEDFFIQFKKDYGHENNM